MGCFDRPRRVVIVGAGLGGTATAIRFLQFAREPLEIVLLERCSEYRNAGVAYHRAGNHWHHVFNIQAGRMSAFREDVDDFVLWANHEADRSGWPPEWSDFEFTESGPAPRRIYQDYLACRLAEAASEALPGVRLVEADGEALDVEVVTNHVHVTVENATGRVVLEADHVILATGLETRFPAFAAEVLDHSSFVRHPYSESGLERVLAVRPDAVVAIVGTLLTAYDQAALLLRRGHTGKIHMISRSGLTLRTYPPDHQHQVITLPPPRLPAGGYEGREQLVRRFQAEWERACAAVARDHPEIPPVVVSERVSKSWEPYLPEILERIPSFDLHALLDRYGSLLATLRVCAVAYTTEIVDAAMAGAGQIVQTVGRVEEIRGTESGTLVLSISGPEPARTIEADLVISNFGRETDYERVDSPLWANLLRNKIACAHRRTGRGVEVDGHGRLLGPAGGPSGPISVVGSPRDGDEIVRNGRTGAFTFNLAAIKNHSVTVAATVLRQLELCYDENADDIATDQDIERSITLEIRRMVTRRRAVRRLLTDRLEHSLQLTLTGFGGKPLTDRGLRAAVNAAATVRLTDLSVTPRDLRSRLGLDTPGVPGSGR